MWIPSSPDVSFSEVTLVVRGWGIPVSGSINVDVCSCTNALVFQGLHIKLVSVVFRHGKR